MNLKGFMGYGLLACCCLLLLNACGRDNHIYGLEIWAAKESQIGYQVLLEGYLTPDGLLWTYEEDARLHRTGNSIQLVGLTDENLASCSREYTTVTGQLKSIEPLTVGNIGAITIKGSTNACYSESAT